MDLDSPWKEDPHSDHAPAAEWTKVTSEIISCGYREGIEESLLQAGFNAGFANVQLSIESLASICGDFTVSNELSTMRTFRIGMPFMERGLCKRITGTWQ